MSIDKIKLQPICSVCGGNNLATDAVARWDPEAQEWGMTATFDDSGVSCDDCCSDDVEIRWVPVSQEAPQQEGTH